MDGIVTLLKSEGPMTGKDILNRTGKDGFLVWKYCISSPDIIRATIGRRYLRLDSQVEGFARLSPSILREFVGYTVLGVPGQEHEIEQKAEKLMSEIESISSEKLKLAFDVVTKCIDAQGLTDSFNKSACAIIAGDVVYNMAHRDPRPEFSTGKSVRGSDLDIVIITDGLSRQQVKMLDSAIYQQKYRLLTNPLYLEEIDYLIKDFAKVEQQLLFEDFKSMIACKILDEGRLLCGNQEIYQRLKTRLDEMDIPEKLDKLSRQAMMNRKETEISLLNNPGPLSDNELIQLFYTTAEREEFF